MILENRPAKKKPSVNIVKPFTNSAWEIATPVTVVSDYEMKMSSDIPAWDASKLTIDVEVGQTYIVQADIEGAYSVEVFENGFNRGSFTNNSTQSRYLTATYNKWEIRVVRNGQATGYFNIKNLMISKGTSRNPFVPYKEINTESKKVPSKNLVKPFTKWQQTDPNASILNNHEVVINPQSNYKGFRDDTISLQVGGTYSFSIDEITEGAVIFLATIESGTIRYTTLNSTKKSTTFTISSNVTSMWMELHGQTNRGLFTVKNPMLVKGSEVKPFEPYVEVSKKASLLPSKNILPPFTKWVNANTGNVINVTLEPNKASFYSYAAWMGIYTLVPMESITTYTFSFEPNEFISNDLQFYARFIDSKGGQLGGAWPLHRDKTVTTPSGTVQAKITAEPTTSGVRKQLNVPMIQLEKGSLATPMEQYKLVNKVSSLAPNRVPKKNFVQPFTTWIKNPEGEVNVTEASANRLAIEIDAQAKYRGMNMPIDMNILGALKGKTVTLSVGKFTKTNGSGSQIQLRFFGGASGNKDIVLNMNSVGTGVIPSDATNAFLTVQTNNVGKVSIEVEDLQLEVGSVATEYEPYVLVKDYSSVVRKATYRKLPFSFSRESVEVLDGIQYGINSPRIKHGGILVEEGTVNMLSTRPVQPNSPATVEDRGGYYLVAAGANSNFSGAYITGIASKANTTYTLSARFEEVGSAKGKVDFVIEQTGAGTIRKKPTKVGDRYILTFTTSSGVTKISTCFYMSNGVTGDSFILYKDIQLEEKSVMTNYTDKERKNEIPTLPVNFDRQAGSIETEFDFADIPTKSQYIFDTVQNRWIFYKDAWDNKVYVYLDGVQCIGLPKDVLPEGRIKARIEWSNPSVSLYINDKLVGTGSYNGSNYTKKDIYLGTRYTVVEYLNNVIYSMVVKDRNGNIIASM